MAELVLSQALGVLTAGVEEIKRKAVVLWGAIE